MSQSEYEIRPVTEAELPAMQAVTDYAFASPVQAEPEPSNLSAEWSLAALTEGEVVASSGGYPFRLRFNGASMSAQGVTLVGTHPSHRRRGIVRRLITGLLERAHDEGTPISILWASMGAIYQRFGYGLATTAVQYDIEPRHMVFQTDTPVPGQVSLLEAEAAREACEAIYRAFIRDRTLMLQRPPILWDIDFRTVDKQKVHCAVYRTLDGAATAYALFRVFQPPATDMADGQKIVVVDSAWTDMAGYRAIWEFLASHDLVSRVEWPGVCADDPAPNVLLEPRMLRRTTRDGIWLRVVDVDKALGGRGYDHAGRCVIGVPDDPECPWNKGTYLLETQPAGAQSEGGTTVTRTQAAVDLQVTQQGLASLVCGHARASELHRCGRINATDPAKLPMWDALFATRHSPSLMNGF